MKVIIIGSEGFIGSHVYKYFRDSGEDAWGADITSDATDPAFFFKLNREALDYNHLFQNSNFDLCINCSGAASVPASMNDPIIDFQLNTVNVFKMLEAIRKYNPDCKFINLSSAAVYGNPASLPVREEMTPGPLSPYGYHKLSSELLCQEFFKLFKLKTCSLRIFSVYGKGSRKQLFWDLYQKALKENRVNLFGTGNESRDFINIHDLVRAIVKVSENSTFEADVLNVANGVEVKIMEAAEVFFGLFNKKIEYTFTGEERKGDPVNWKADISKLLKYGYTQEIGFGDGLLEYYNWLKDIE